MKQKYAVRVELRGTPSFETYQQLHRLMATFGFLQTINGVTNDKQPITKALPHATYFGTSTYDCGTVRNFLQAAIKEQIQPEIILFVVQSATWAIG